MLQFFLPFHGVNAVRFTYMFNYAILFAARFEAFRACFYGFYWLYFSSAQK